MEKFDITIVGAGVVGLAIAAELSQTGQSVLLLEKNKKFGQETSSRNSEVIHAGIYYSTDSLKARLCVEGRELLYETCEKHNIPYKKCGKLIVAVKDHEIPSLEHLKKQAEANGITDLKFLDEKDVKKIEPFINTVCTLHSPSTGIIDSHSLMLYFLAKAERNNVMVSYNTPLAGLCKDRGGWICEVQEENGEKTTIFSRTVINSAGLFSAHVASMAGIDYKLHYCKGEYFSVGNGKYRFIRGLVYPSPHHDLVSLGIHSVVDLKGGFKLGPNAYYVNEIDYSVNTDHLEDFYESTKDFLPFIKKEDLSPDMSGIRPHLQGPGEKAKDFIIKKETGEHEGLINLIGINSPGLTSSMAIAKYVKALIE